MQQHLFDQHKGKAGLMSLVIASLGLFWISQLIQPDSYRILGGAIWLVLCYGALNDWKTRTVHDGVSVIVLLLGGIYCLATRQPLIHWGLGLLLNGLLMGLVYLLSRKALGLGDVRLLIALGMFLGPLRSYYLLFHASWLGALTVLAGFALRKVNRNQELPFIPFIAAGYLLAISSV